MSTDNKPPRALYIGGPTAVGKSALSMHLAQELDAELVNADSVQLYRGLDIGSAKPSETERQLVPHHLLDVLDPDEDNNVADFAQMARATIRAIQSRGKQAIVVGGTGLYLRVLVHGILDAPPPSEEIRAVHKELLDEHGSPHLHAMLAQVDPPLAERLHPNDFIRISRGLEVFEQTGDRLSHLQDEHNFAEPKLDALKIGLLRPRDELYDRINLRVDQMMQAGFLDEVRGLIEAGYGPDLKPMQALGYRQLCAHLQGELELDEAIELIKRDTRRYAKKNQIGWLRREQDLHWTRAPLLDEQGQLPATILDELRSFLRDGQQPALAWAQLDSYSI